MIQRIIEKIYAPLTINAVKFSEIIQAPEASSVAYLVNASAAAAPVGTTIAVQGSIDGVAFADVGADVTIGGNVAQAVFALTANYRYYRLIYRWTSGSYVATTGVLVRGEA